MYQIVTKIKNNTRQTHKTHTIHTSHAFDIEMTRCFIMFSCVFFFCVWVESTISQNNFAAHAAKLSVFCGEFRYKWQKGHEILIVLQDVSVFFGKVIDFKGKNLAQTPVFIMNGSVLTIFLSIETYSLTKYGHFCYQAKSLVEYITHLRVFRSFKFWGMGGKGDEKR